jgi:hypothetical protein
MTLRSIHFPSGSACGPNDCGANGVGSNQEDDRCFGMRTIDDHLSTVEVVPSANHMRFPTDFRG